MAIETDNIAPRCASKTRISPHSDDVTAVAPPNSFIHAEDFKSPEELVKYLGPFSR